MKLVNSRPLNCLPNRIGNGKISLKLRKRLKLCYIVTIEILTIIKENGPTLYLKFIVHQDPKSVLHPSINLNWATTKIAPEFVNLSYINLIIKMDYVGLVSGGKDSIYNLMQCNAHGHNLVCLANLHPE